MILDQDILRGLLTGNAAARDKIQSLLQQGHDLKTTAIVARELELEYPKNRDVLAKLFSGLTVLPFDERAARLARELTAKDMNEAIIEASGETLVTKKSYRCRVEKW